MQATHELALFRRERPAGCARITKHSRASMDRDDVEKQSLQDEMSSVLEEARMVIPGVQALFGFQTMAVFNQRFEDLPTAGMLAYLAGLGLLALAIALLLTPAAYHRLAERGRVSRRMIDVASRFITIGMVPLMAGLSLDIYVVVLAAVDDHLVAALAGLVTALAFTGFWFAYPFAWRARRGGG